MTIKYYHSQSLCHISPSSIKPLWGFHGGSGLWPGNNPSRLSFSLRFRVLARLRWSYIKVHMISPYSARGGLYQVRSQRVSRWHNGTFHPSTFRGYPNRRITGDCVGFLTRWRSSKSRFCLALNFWFSFLNSAKYDQVGWSCSGNRGTRVRSCLPINNSEGLRLHHGSGVAR